MSEPVEVLRFDNGSHYLEIATYEKGVEIGVRQQSPKTLDDAFSDIVFVPNYLQDELKSYFRIETKVETISAHTTQPASSNYDPIAVEIDRELNRIKDLNLQTALIAALSALRNIK